MIYIECRNCKFVCTCCASLKDGTSCSGCENHFDEFKPAENINYCPMTGKRVISHKNISCKHVRDNGTCAKRASNSGKCEYPCSYYECASNT